MSRTLLLASLLGATTAPLVAQDSTDLVVGTTLRITSAILSQERAMDVILPRSYGQGRERYPVLVVLDGESQGVLAATVARFLASETLIPELIVVGVRNRDRNLDYTPAAVAGYRPPMAEGTYGGADRFLTFLESELLPAIEARYRTQPYRLLAGHSLGGLFVLHALGSRPAVFQGYLALDPSAWWNNRAVIEQVRTVLAQQADSRLRLVVAEAVPGVGGDWELIASAAGPQFVGKRIQISAESHGTMPLKGIPDGLRALFADYAPKPLTQGIAPLAQVRTRFEALSQAFGYPIAPPARELVAAAEASLAGQLLEDADAAVALLERHYGPLAAGDRLRGEIAEARTAPDDPDFVPLEFPTPRPSPVAGRALLGTWRGMVLVPGGTDYETTITLRASGDTILAESQLRFNNGEPLAKKPLPLVRLIEGGIEWGVPLRGMAGMQVYVARLTSDGTALEGVEEIRGARFTPQIKAAIKDRKPSTFRLERIGGSPP